jgi:hypothetical protein
MNLRKGGSGGFDYINKNGLILRSAQVKGGKTTQLKHPETKNNLKMVHTLYSLIFL